MTRLRGNGTVVLFGSLSVLRSFALAGIRVVAADSDAESLTIKSRFCRGYRLIACPRNEPERAVADLIEYGQQFDDRPMLAYDNDAMLLLVSRNRDALAQYYRFLLPDAELIEDLVGKLRFSSFARRLDLPVPKTITVDDSMTAEEVAQEVGLPCILKPDSHTGRFLEAVLQNEHDRPHKVLTAGSLEDLRLTFERMRRYCQSFVAQQLITGDDGQLFSYHAYVGRDHRPIAAYCGRKVRTYPKDTGFSTCLRLIDNPELMSLGNEVMSRMKYVGPMKLDFKRDEKTGRYFLLEANPRFNLWHYLGTASGINLPLIAYRDLWGEPIPQTQGYRTNKQWISLGNDLRAFVREYRPAGQWGWGSWALSLLRPSVYEVFSWRDPWPAIVNVTRYLRANLKKVRRLFARTSKPVGAAVHPAT